MSREPDVCMISVNGWAEAVARLGQGSGVLSPAVLPFLLIHGPSEVLARLSKAMPPFCPAYRWREAVVRLGNGYGAHGGSVSSPMALKSLRCQRHVSPWQEWVRPAWMQVRVETSLWPVWGPWRHKTQSTSCIGCSMEKWLCASYEHIYQIW